VVDGSAQRPGTVISHLSLGVRDLGRAVAFYDTVLATLGSVRVWTSARGAGYGPPGENDKLALFSTDGVVVAGAGFHLAFGAASPAAVDAFHAATLKAGATCHGPPGPRPQYGPAYYAAFVRDLDGHVLEAVHQ
jgi:catechol 2,3-dioxygenase-like lactoylglutathione lyase family enzyme